MKGLDMAPPPTQQKKPKDWLEQLIADNKPERDKKQLTSQQAIFERDLNALSDFSNNAGKDPRPFNPSVANNALSQLPPLTPRSPQENNAVTGLVMYPESTGLPTNQQGQQVLAREQAEKKAAFNRMQFRQRAKRLQQRTDRAINATGTAEDENARIRSINDDRLTKRKSRKNWQDKRWQDSLTGPLEDSGQALHRYRFGDGSPQELSDDVKEKIKGHDRFKWQIERLENGDTDLSDSYVDLDMEGGGWDGYHIGDTVATYTITCDGPSCIAKFKAPMFDRNGSKPDEFADPLSIGSDFPGNPYPYSPFEWEVPFKNPNWKKQ